MITFEGVIGALFILLWGMLLMGIVFIWETVKLLSNIKKTIVKMLTQRK